MLWYIIDGWNVVHKVSKLKNSAQPRKDLVLFIKKHQLCGSHNNKVTVVFDGHFDSTEHGSDAVVKVLYSMDETADEVIKRLIDRHQNKKQIVVVSNDREIITYSKDKNAQTLKVDEFTKKSLVKKIDTDESDQRDLPYSVEKEINQELKKIWLNES
jgi:predicted RNA-binding protein with PIN domain